MAKLLLQPPWRPPRKDHRGMLKMAFGSKSTMPYHHGQYFKTLLPTYFSDIIVIYVIYGNLDCHRLSSMLEVLDLEAAALYSFKSQAQRLEALQQFKSGKVSILLATDVASRGLDIPTVDLVINYDVPRFPRDYVHRVGRTARAGRGGLALSLVTQVFSAKNVAEMKMLDDGFEEKAKERKKQKLKLLAENGLLNKSGKKRKRNKGSAEGKKQKKEVEASADKSSIKMVSKKRKNEERKLAEQETKFGSKTEEELHAYACYSRTSPRLDSFGHA
ncbi:hypothetical protein PIB30_076441 [Stylosanthes scabra]|uniref:Helicase C-terminal domain-containing protein n=1 Tax=Stylosanthes scabra TaxID=79078 RepID=A0ABU6UPM7_9FABA|nr:hypothetical protein [Stylosanthes scabra]